MAPPSSQQNGHEHKTEQKMPAEPERATSLQFGVTKETNAQGEWTEVRRRRRLPSRSYDNNTGANDVGPQEYEELEFEFDEDLLRVCDQPAGRSRVKGLSSGGDMHAGSCQGVCAANGDGQRRLGRRCSVGD